MQSQVYHAHFYQDELAHQSMLQAINASACTTRNTIASKISRKIAGRSILAFEYAVEGLFVTLDNGMQLHLFLADNKVRFNLIDASKAERPSDEQCVRCNCLLKIDGLSEPYAWNTEMIRQRIEGSVVAVFGANNSSAYLDIGNTVALRVSRMFIDEHGLDVLFFDVD